MPFDEGLKVKDLVVMPLIGSVVVITCAVPFAKDKEACANRLTSTPPRKPRPSRRGMSRWLVTRRLSRCKTVLSVWSGLSTSSPTTCPGVQSLKKR